jgi:hypothetical protein
MASFNFSDFYIGYPGHPRFVDKELITDELVRVIVQKYEMIVFTNKGEVFGDPEFGADLPKLLFETKVSATNVEKDIRDQISTYIPEIKSIPYELLVSFYQDPENYQDVMEIFFKIKEYDVYLTIS